MPTVSSLEMYSLAASQPSSLLEDKNVAEGIVAASDWEQPLILDTSVERKLASCHPPNCERMSIKNLIRKVCRTVANLSTIVLSVRHHKLRVCMYFYSKKCNHDENHVLKKLQHELFDLFHLPPFMFILLFLVKTHMCICFFHLKSISFIDLERITTGCVRMTWSKTWHLWKLLTWKESFLHCSIISLYHAFNLKGYFWGPDLK